MGRAHVAAGTENAVRKTVSRRQLVLPAALLVAIAVSFAGNGATSGECRGSPVVATLLAADPADAIYVVGGARVALRRGVAATPAAPGSAAVVRTEVFGTPALGDLNGDGDADAVLWLVQQPGGNGTFVYIAAAIKEAGGFRGTEAVLMGDRIAPGKMTVARGIVTARFADRRPDQPMAAPPTIEVVRRFTLGPHGLVPAVSE